MRWPVASVLRRNVAANLVGSGWTALLGFAFIPVYLRYLGIEAYGLVGFFATLQGVFGLFDLGLGATVNRELARLSATPAQRDEQREVLRTLEVSYWAVSLAIGALVFLLAPPIAHRWIHAEHLSPATTLGAVRLMGVALALQFPFSFYQGALMGLQRQVELNVILTVTGTLRSVGTAVAVAVQPTVAVFFLCQLAVGLCQIVWIVWAVWGTLGGHGGSRPSLARLASVRRFATAITVNAVVGVSLTQLDKVLLSRLLTLEQFGYYALAGTVTAVVWTVAIPVNQALFPRFAQLYELRDRAALAALYHRATQFMVVLLVPLAATVALFAHQLIWLWTRSSVTADHTALVASLLVAGTTVNAIVSVPGYLQTAAGWPELMMYTNTAAACALVPAILIVAPRFGAPGAAFVWLALNAGYLVVNIPLMHRRLLPEELWQWYIADVARPTLGGLVVVLLGRAAMHAEGQFVTAAYCFLVWLAALAVSVLLAPRVREAITGRASVLAGEALS